jgi:hypothetical protein
MVIYLDRVSYVGLSFASYTPIVILQNAMFFFSNEYFNKQRTSSAQNQRAEKEVKWYDR